MAVRKAIWKNDTQFLYGPPTFTDTELVGVGDPAYIALKDKGPSDDNVPFTVPGDYTYNPLHIEVVAGRAMLKGAAVGSHDWPFTVPANYVYNAAKIEVAGGIAKLKGLPVIPHAWWHLNEVAGATAFDSSGHGRNATLVNMEDADWVPGKLNNCLLFDGVNEYMDCGNIADFCVLDAFSAEFWVRTTTASKFVLSRCNGTIGWEVYIATGGKIFFSLNNDISGGNRATRYSVNSITDGAWHHVICTYDGLGHNTGMKVYIDGVEQATSGVDGLTGDISVAINLHAARRASGGSTFPGHLDEIVIYDKELDVTEVAIRYNAGAGTESMPGAYPLDNPSIYPTSGYVFAVPLDSFIETSTKPVNTQIQYHVSSDDGVTWKYWNGAAWVVTDGSYAQSNTAAVVQANLASLAVAGTFRFRALLHTSDDTKTPELDNVHIAQGISYPVGAFEISMNTDIQPITVIQWTATEETVVKPLNTDILYQFSIDGGGIWNGSWLTEPQLEIAVQAIIAHKDGTDKIRFKFQLSTTSPAVTPEIDNLKITHSQGYQLTGKYTSTKYVPEGAWMGISVKTITFSVTTPGGTTVTIGARVVDHVLEDNYTSPWTSYNSGDSIDTCGTLIQFEAILTTTDAAITPQLNELSIEFHMMVGIFGSAVWDEPMSSHNISGTAGQALNRVHKGRIAEEGKVVAGSSVIEIKTDLAQPDDFFNGMYIVIVNALGTVMRRIDQYTNLNGACWLDDPLPFVPVASDIVYIIALQSCQSGSAK